MTSKQRAHLRAMANDQQPVVYIGKEGVTDAVIASTALVLEARELIKVQVLKNAPEGCRETCDALAQTLYADPVQCIGNRFVLYKQAREPEKRRIRLPR